MDPDQTLLHQEQSDLHSLSMRLLKHSQRQQMQMLLLLFAAVDALMLILYLMYTLLHSKSQYIIKHRIDRYICMSFASSSHENMFFIAQMACLLRYFTDLVNFSTDYEF